jgi:hypothetical protein
MNSTDAIEPMRQVIRRKHKAEDSYVLRVRRYIRAPRHIPPELPSTKKVERFLTDLARVHDVSDSTQNQAFNAISSFISRCSNSL